MQALNTGNRWQMHMNSLGIAAPPTDPSMGYFSSLGRNNNVDPGRASMPPLWTAQVLESEGPGKKNGVDWLSAGVNFQISPGL